MALHSCLQFRCDNTYHSWNGKTPHYLSNWDSHITRQLGYKHSCCQNVVSTKKNCLSLCFLKNVTCLSVGLLRIIHGLSSGEMCTMGYDKLLFHEQNTINISQAVVLWYIYIYKCQKAMKMHNLIKWDLKHSQYGLCTYSFLQCDTT